MADQFDIDNIISGAIAESPTPVATPTPETLTAAVTNRPVSVVSALAEPKPVIFLKTLPTETQDKIKAQTPALVEKFVGDENYLLTFGTTAVENVNQLVNKILEEQKHIVIPEIDDMLRNANRELTGFSTKYNTVDKASLEQKEGFFAKLFKSGQSKLNDLYFDSKNIEEKMDKLAADIVKQEDVLSRNIVSGQMLIDENTKSIEPLIGVIALIESSDMEAGSQAAALQTQLAAAQPNSPEYNEIQNKLSRVAEVMDRLEQRHTEFVSRLYVAWANSPQLRNLIKISSDLKSKLSLIRLNTIPTMKLTIAQLGFLQQLKTTSKIASTVDEANNNALQMLAATAKETIPEVERQVQNPSITVDSIVKIADSIVAQNQGLIEAIQEGRKNRQAVEASIIQSAQTIADSTKLRDAKIIEGITQNAQTALETAGTTEENAN